MKNILYLASLFLLLSASKCEKGPTYELDQSFQLMPKKSATCNCKDKLDVQFVNIKEDSRCPKNVNCIWAGQVISVLSINGEQVELTLGSKKKGQSFRVIDGYMVQLKAVTPYPIDDKRIAAEDYVVELMVKSKP